MTTPLIAGLLGIILLVCVCLTMEGFTSPGTMVQLASSRVPTETDRKYFQEVYPAQVRHDLIDMTGGDPGPLHIPMPQLWM